MSSPDCCPCPRPWVDRRRRAATSQMLTAATLEGLSSSVDPPPRLPSALHVHRERWDPLRTRAPTSVGSRQPSRTPSHCRNSCLLFEELEFEAVLAWRTRHMNLEPGRPTILRDLLNADAVTFLRLSLLKRRARKRPGGPFRKSIGKVPLRHCRHHRAAKVSVTSGGRRHDRVQRLGLCGPRDRSRAEDRDRYRQGPSRRHAHAV